MKKILVLAVLLSFSLTSCSGQEKSKEIAQQKDTIKPQVKVDVKKEYDEYGNLIRIDSTYSSFYSNIKGDSLLEKEIFEKFRKQFHTRHFSIDSLFMDDFFTEDPFKLHDFYTDEFFQNNFKLHQERLENIFREMDSIKNRYYKRSEKKLQNRI